MNLGGTRATVIGAGIGGAATALLLARAGAEVTVLERDGHRRSIGGGIILQPNGMAVLAGLGLAGAIEKEAHCSALTTIRDAEERERPRSRHLRTGRDSTTLSRCDGASSRA